MTDIRYIGEHLWIGQIGHFAILLGFVSSIFAAYSYLKAKNSDDDNWLKMGRMGYIIHGLTVFTIVGLLLYAMMNKFYEFGYVQRQVSDELPWYYTFSALWQGQEGSFLLWMFWHSVLGFILIKTAKRWEPGVMAILAMVEGFLMSMILGLYIPFTDDQKMGSNPFGLLRDTMDAPIFSNADYLSLITGSGLNPLLQNYWMTIHPPVLFLGFASVTIPFCFAMAGLMERAHKDWLGAAWKWATFSAFIFGLGILMGGAWAYEALSFGGYWAWDPVENSSLVPWLVIVAAVHTHLIAKNTGRAIGTTYIYYGLAFILVLYSTFLTRSGVLGDTSVHAFTEMGLENQLILFMSFFTLLGIYYYFRNRSSIPKIEKEEALYSREFWMFIGAMVLLFSGILLTISTSLPVYNKIVQVFNPDYVGQVVTDQVAHHNKYQLWIGVFIGLLSSSALLLRYRGINWDRQKVKFTKHGASILAASVLGTWLIGLNLDTTTWQHHVLLFSALVAVLTNLDYVFLYTKNNSAQLSSFLSHFGFGVLIIGVLFSGLNKRHISTNPFAQRGITDDDQLSTTVTLIKERPFFMNDFWVNYESDTLTGNLRKFDIKFKEINEANEVLDSFTVQPSAIYSNDFRTIAAWNPSTKRFLHKDIFTQVAGYPQHLLDIEAAKALEDSMKYQSHIITNDAVIDREKYSVHLLGVNYDPVLEQHDSSSYDMGIGLNLEVRSKLSDDKSYVVQPALGLKNALVYQFPRTVDDLGIKIRVSDDLFSRVYEDEATLEYEKIQMKEGESTRWNGLDIRLDGFNRTPQNPNYRKENGDIALAARLLLSDGQRSSAIEPLFIIRNSQQFSIKEYDPNFGLHIRFSGIDPATELMTFNIARVKNLSSEYSIEIAENVPRSDILVLEAQVFPGINLVWAGSLMMLFGFLVSMLRKRKILA